MQRFFFKDIPVFSLLSARFHERICWDFADAKEDKEGYDIVGMIGIMLVIPQNNE